MLSQNETRWYLPIDKKPYRLTPKLEKVDKFLLYILQRVGRQNEWFWKFLVAFCQKLLNNLYRRGELKRSRERFDW